MFKNLKALFIDNKLKSSYRSSLDKSNLLIGSGQKIKVQRINLGISRAQLSKITKISVAVIEAIENGWNQKLPETTYLAPMLKTLEKELKLPNECLTQSIKLDPDKNEALTTTSPISASLSIFNSTQGIILYIIFIFLSILLLNKYQLKLSKNNLQTISPVLYNPTLEGEEIYKNDKQINVIKK